MWFNNSPEAGNWLIDKCAEFGVVPVSFRAHAPNAIIPESYDYHMFVNVGDHQFDSKCGYFAATNVLYEDSQNAEKYEHPATYFFNTKAQELLVEDGRVTGVFAQRDGELWLFRATKGVILATDGKISDIVVNSHAESSDIGAPALDQLIQNAIDHLLTNRTSFLVAHRLSTIRKADVILVVKDGHIVEQGKHEELLRRKGYYHDLYSKQFAQENAARILGEGSAQ